MGTRQSQKKLKPKKGLHFVETVAPRPKTATEFKRRTRTISTSDAELIVRWLNASIGAPSNERVLAIRQELEELHTEFDALLQQQKELREMDPLKAAPKVREYARQSEHYRERHNALNMRLSNYNKFRPVLPYSLNTGEWGYNLVSDDGWRGFQLEVSDENAITVTVQESDVVAALARLAAGRELTKVRLCANCHERWRVSLRDMDRFCGDECREEFNRHTEKYRERKRKSQREYRKQLKLDKRKRASPRRTGK